MLGAAAYPRQLNRTARRADGRARARAFVPRWMSDDMTYCERRGEISPPYENHGMSDGDTLREDWFPILWRKG
jgi:hypothetical protein